MGGGSAITPAVPAVCRFHLQGNCTKGSDCPFSHGEEKVGASAAAPKYLARGGQQIEQEKERQKGKGKGKVKSRGRSATPFSPQSNETPALATIKGSAAGKSGDGERQV